MRPPLIPKRLLVAFATLLVSGCAPFVLVPPERQTVGGVISVQPGVKWNRMVTHNFRGSVEVWTLDGPGLNTLLFFTGVPDGEPLFMRAAAAAQAAQQEKPAVFRASMNPVEVQELLEATMVRNFRTTIAEGRNLKPVAVAHGQGFPFETRLIGRDEV